MQKEPAATGSKEQGESAWRITLPTQGQQLACESKKMNGRSVRLLIKRKRIQSIAQAEGRYITYNEHL
jgi:hypothetical protein